MPRPGRLCSKQPSRAAFGTTRHQSCDALQGYANYLATQRPHTVDNSHFLNSQKGTMSFFNTGSSLFASDNGLAEAQKFYKGRRK